MGQRCLFYNTGKNVGFAVYLARLRIVVRKRIDARESQVELLRALTSGKENTHHVMFDSEYTLQWWVEPC